MDPFDNDRSTLPRNMIENSMFEEEPDVVDLAKDSPSYPIDSDDVVYEPRSSRLLVRGLGENELEEDEEDYESSARLLGMSFMNRSSSSQRSAAASYSRQHTSGLCSMPSVKTMVLGVLLLVFIASLVMVIYFIPKCTFSKEGCHNASAPMEVIYPISKSGDLFPWTALRLPNSVHPVDYEISLHPNLSTMSFTGSVAITVVVLQETKKVVLHSSGLKIQNVTFQGKEVKLFEYEPWQQIAIKFSEELKKGQKYVLNMNYSANLSSSFDGFYNSSYTDMNGHRRVLAATQFEPLAARKAFPCFDEPAFKATFLIKIKREVEYISLSNMPLAKTNVLPDGLFEDVFQKSVSMSTYLVAFIVANFTSVSRNVSNTQVSVYAVPDKKDQVDYALETAARLLQFYNSFFEIEYPLHKLDLVGIPDFMAGAMENWGLITFRETMLLVGNHSSPMDKQLVSSVIAHELAHQWFGNLVTMRWWNDLWLNEGFATYMQYLSIEKGFPNLDINNDFLNVRFRALEKDAMNSSHPVSAKVTAPEEVEEMFDSVSYEKGASLLLMLNTTLGEGVFKKGVIEYLKKYTGSNTEKEDLWNSLSQFTKPSIDVAEMMNTWTVQKGFPLITVNWTGNQVKVTQERFLLNAANITDHSDLWHIPLTYINNTCTSSISCKQKFYLKEKTATFNLPGVVKWLKFNYQSEGFYVVDYRGEGWSALITALKENVNVLPPEDRASLINNVFALSRLGKVSFRQVLTLLEYLKNETETAPVTEALTQLGSIYRLLEKRSDLNLVARMKTYIFDHFGNLMDNQSWGEESSVSKVSLRSVLLETACALSRPTCTKKAKELFDQWKSLNKTVPGDLLRAVLSVAAQNDEDWNTLYESYIHSIYDSEKRKTLEALCSTQDMRKIAWILKAGLNGSPVQTPELPLVISRVSRHFAGYLYTWDFVKENWHKLTEIFPIGSFPLQNIIMSTTSHFSTKTHLEEVQRFFSSLKERGSQMRSVQEAVENIQRNIFWMEKNLGTLREWL